MGNLGRSGCAGLAFAGVLACGVLLAPGLLAPARAAGPVGGDGDPPLLDLRIDGPLLSADLRNAPLGEVLRELAARSGFELATDAPIETRVTLSRSRVSLGELLDELLRGCSWIAEYGPGQERFEEHRPGTRSAPEPPIMLLVIPSEACSLGPRDAATPLTETPTAAQRAARDLALATAAPDREELHVRQKALHRAINGLDRPPVEDLAQAARTAPDLSIRILSVMALGREADPGARAVLVESLSDDNLAVRRAAVRGLARTWGADAVEPLASVLTRDPDPALIRETASRLARIGTDAAWQRLELAAAAGDPQVRTIVRNVIEASRARQANPAPDQ